MHTVFSLWNSDDQLCKASSDDIQVCAEVAEFRPIIRYDDDIFHHERQKFVPASDAQKATDILSA